MNSDPKSNLKLLKSLLKKESPDSFNDLRIYSWKSDELSDVISLNNLRKKNPYFSKLLSKEKTNKIKIAILSGYTTFPMEEMVNHFLNLEFFEVIMLVGDYDNYVNEILDPESQLNNFTPDVTILLPSLERCKYGGQINDPLESVEKEVTYQAKEILSLCETLFQKHKTNIILGNFPLPKLHGIGPLRTKLPTSLWNFRKNVNLQIARRSPFYIHICDIEFITCCFGLNRSLNERKWLEIKQPFDSKVILKIAKEISLIVIKLFREQKKVLVVDADNTLWGGVAGDEDIETLELGNSSSRGEGFKNFQHYLLSLKSRGILLALCSKNDHKTVENVLSKHPEMLLKIEDFSSLKVNWNPKSDNLIDIADELNLGLSSFVFIDDNPAEIELVKQQCKDVTSICIGSDPSNFIELIDAERIFETLSLTEEDLKRNSLYISEKNRKVFRSTVNSYDQYLASLKMTGTISQFTKHDAPRITQLINKSNQFNLTTIRRSHSDVIQISEDKDYYAFTFRLEDKFGDHGLISVTILKVEKSSLIIDTWLMSCRVLKRQLEEEVMNEIQFIANKLGIKKIIGNYSATKKNSLVKDLLAKMGMKDSKHTKRSVQYLMYTDNFKKFKTRIKVVRR